MKDHHLGKRQRMSTSGSEYCMVDHTKLDLPVVDPEMKMPIGRPWLTIAFDTLSKCIVAISVHMEPINGSTAHLLLPMPAQRRKKA